jgi:hypothetical protein
MKHFFRKGIFLIACIIYSITCFAQQTASINNTATITLPNGSIKITTDQGIDHVQNIYKIKSPGYQLFFLDNPQYTYKVHNIIISFNTDTPRVNLNLLQTKRGLDALLKSRNRDYSSAIKQINNNQILVNNFVSGKMRYYNFNAHNQSDTKVVTGKLCCLNEDTKKASQIFNQILASIKFEE